MTIKEEIAERRKYGANIDALSGKYSPAKLHKLHKISRRSEQPDPKKLNFRVGCFYCGEIFNGRKIKEFTHWPTRKALRKDKKKALAQGPYEYEAICPYCGIDSVLFSTDIEITKELLNDMYIWWFQAHIPFDVVKMKEKFKEKARERKKLN